MSRDTTLERQVAQLRYFNKTLARLDNEMLYLSRDQVRISTAAALEAQKTEFDKVGEDVIRALGGFESVVFQNIAKSSGDVQVHIDDIGAALVNATTELSKAWTKHFDAEQELRQDKAYTRRRVVRLTRQEIWDEKCRIVDGEDAIRDREIAEWEQQCEGFEEASRSLDLDEQRTVTPTPSKEMANIHASNGDPATPPESPRSAEILSDIGAEISRLEADHEAAANIIKAEQEAHVAAASTIDSLQSQIVLLEKTLAKTNRELRDLQAEKLQPKSLTKKRRHTRSEGELVHRASMVQQLPPVEIRNRRDDPEAKEYVLVGSDEKEIKAIAAELAKEKENHALTLAQLSELQDFVKMRDSCIELGDLKRYMKKLKPPKSGRSTASIQKDLEEATKALSVEKEEHAETKAKVKSLEEQMKLKEPLVDVGRKVRCKFLENSKRVYFNGTVVDIRGQANLEVIRAGGEAAYQGDAQADAALFSLGFLDPSTDKALFEELYACPVLVPPSRALNYPKLTEMFNMRATLGYCSSFTNYTMSEDDDARFQFLEHECISILSSIQRNSAAMDSSEIAKENNKMAFENNPEVGEKLQEMKDIVQHILWLERTRSKMHL